MFNSLSVRDRMIFAVLLLSPNVVANAENVVPVPAEKNAEEIALVDRVGDAAKTAGAVVKQLNDASGGWAATGTAAAVTGVAMLSTDHPATRFLAIYGTKLLTAGTRSRRFV